MKTTITIVARVAIIGLILYRIGLFSIWGDLSFTRKMPFERERFLQDSLRKVAEPIVARAEKLAAENKYTVNMYFDDMTNLKLIEKSVGLEAYSGFSTINHLQDLSYRNTAFNSSDIKGAQDKYLPRITPNYCAQTPPIDWWNEVWKVLLLFIYKWYFALFPFALLWYFTQLYSDPNRLYYLKAKPLRAIGMLLIYPYTLLWGILRKASDGYDYVSVAAELERRGVKASHFNVLKTLNDYRNSSSKTLDAFLEDRGFVVKHSVLIGFLFASFSCFTFCGKTIVSKVKKDTQAIENANHCTTIVHICSDTHFKTSTAKYFVYINDCTFFENLSIYVVYIKRYVYNFFVALLSGFPPGIGHIPWNKVNFFFKKVYLIIPNQYEKYNKNNNNNLYYKCTSTKRFYYLVQSSFS